MLPIAEIVRKYDLAPKKSLGQNFLFDLNVTDKIVKYAGDLSGKTLFEIGPGPGGLTYSILKAKPKKLIAIERDSRAVAALQGELATDYSNLIIANEDALKIDECVLADGERFQIIANLPYNISVPLLIKWLYQREFIDSMTLMFQKEVADRIVAKHGSKAYGRISVLVQSFCKVEHLFDLPPTVFIPPPKVKSSVVKITPLKSSIIKDINIKRLEDFTRILFEQRRKMLRSILKNHIPETKLTELGIAPTLRPEQLSVLQIAMLSQQLI